METKTRMGGKEAMIPRRLFSWWSGDCPLSWLKKQTLYTFAKHHPDWKVVLYYDSCHSPPSVGSGYSIELRAVNPSFPTLHPRLRSDIFRWGKLHEEGGVWTDLDVVYFRAIDDFIEDLNRRGQTAGVTLDGGTAWRFSIGLCAGAPGSSFWKKVHDLAVVCRNQPGDQVTGTAMLAEHWGYLATKEVGNLPYSMIYRTWWSQKQVAQIWQNKKKVWLDYPACGIHWFSSRKDSQEWEKHLDGGNYRSYQNPVCQALRKAYDNQ